MKFKKNSIILLIGPSNSGKSYFAQNILKPLNPVIVSSDNLRRFLVGEDCHKYDKKMMPVSSQAFDLLYAEVKARSSYPVNNPFIVVDSTGLAEKFREDICQIARDNNYHCYALVFYYNKREDYYKYGDSPVINKHIKKLIEQLKYITKSKFTDKYIIKSIDFTETVEIEDESKSIRLEENVSIVADIHGCPEFKELIPKLSGQILLLGDYIDKNSPENIKSTVDFIYDNKDKFILLKGNHEHFYYLHKTNPSSWNNSLIENYFSTLLINDSELERKIIELYNLSYDFAYNDYLIATHSPCRNIFLGKTDKNSLKQQRNLRYSHVTNYNEFFQFIFNEANVIHPIHVFGHIALDQPLVFKNKLGIDTGATLGGGLTAAIFHGKNYELVSVPTQQYVQDSFISLRRKIEYIVPEHMTYRYNKICNGKVNYISGTMSPPPANEHLETVKAAWDYFQQEGQSELVVQKKMMGSRFQVYLKPDVNECYGVTRSGFVYNNDLLKPEYERLQQKLKKYFDDRVECLIIDSELMPWKLLGQSLIERHFYGIWEMANGINEKLNEYGFNDALNQIRDNPPKEWNIPKEEFNKKYGHHLFKTYEGYYRIQPNYTSYEVNKFNLDNFKKQVDLYGSDGDIRIYPFFLLKIVYPDREVYPRDNYESFNELNEEKCWLVLSYEEMKTAFDSLGYEYEGIVVKPRMIGDTVPYLKVRNPEYLRIVYGYDYLNPVKYQKLVQRKKVFRKISTSKKEFKISEEMLRIKYNELDSQDFRNLVAQMLAEETKLVGVDPRL